MSGVAPIQASTELPAATFADLIWPVGATRSPTLLRGVILSVMGACLLTMSAKVVVPGPINITLQSLVVLMLGAVLGARLSVASVALYVAEGALGLPVFTNTPPLPAGLAYLVGPTGGFLVGFALAALIVGWAADRGAIKRPLVFALALVTAELALMALGYLWLAFFAHVGPGFSGIGFSRAWTVAVAPFMLGETIKVALAAVALPVLWDAARRLLQR
jgi:biotin transport system substrate-specific component